MQRRSTRSTNARTADTKIKQEPPTPKKASANASQKSNKRVRTPIKSEEDQDDDHEDVASVRPTKKAKTKVNVKKESKEKPKPDLEAGAKLANSMAAESSPAKKSNPYNLTPGASPYPTYPRPTPAECQLVYDRLAKVHGHVKQPETIPPPSIKSSGCGEVPSVLDALVRTRLSANTNNRNSNSAFEGLVKRFGLVEEGVGKGSVDWDNVRRTDVNELFEAIKHGGLAAVKSKDIKQILDLVYEENEEQRNKEGTSKGKKSDKTVLSLDHLHSMATEEAFDKLLGYPGIGPKTASCVLLFCMRRPSFAVDTHVFRLTRWLGWTPSDAQIRRMGKEMKANSNGKPPPPVSRNTTYSHLDCRIPDELKYPLHYLLIRHGKTCPSCMAMRDSKKVEAWGKKPCPIKDLKGTSKRSIKEEDEEDSAGELTS